MSSIREELEFTEPERYELREGPFYRFQISRREFVATLGAGLMISVAVPSVLGQRAERGGRGEAPLSQRLHIGENGVVTLFTSKVEVGQGSRTQLTQAAAEELHLPLSSVRLVMGDTAGPDDGGTAGSRTTPASVPTIRRACAAARQLLIETAAKEFDVEPGTLSVVGGKVEGLPDAKAFGYAELASKKHEGAFKGEAARGVKLAEVQEWRVLGTRVSDVRADDIVTGAHVYPSDIVRPGMLYGKILRPPSYGAVLAELDLSPARAIVGTTAVHDGSFAGVAAANSFAAAEALDAIGKTAHWKVAEHPSSETLYAYLRSKANDRSRPEKKGSPEEELKNGFKALRESYQVAYIQHAPMEPRAAVAEWNEGQLTVWTGSQQPARVRQDLAESLRVPVERVRVIVPDTGGGFGGKHSGEVAVEAARLAREANKPVRVQWTREEEFTWAYFRPAGVIDMAAALDARGGITAWQHVNYNSGASAIATPYAIANSLTEFKSCEQPLRSGSYRGLAATANNFARESFMDELAEAADVDPLEFRLRHVENDRLRGVLTAAAERFGWGKAWRKNGERRTTGVGLACGTEKGSYVACCAEIEVNETTHSFKVRRVVEAFECGAIQNPGNLQAQVEGAIIQGLGGALTEEMQFKDGRMLNGRFGAYRVPRFKDVPSIETVLVNRPDLPSVGAGETPIIGIAPAIANALCHATRVRMRSLPLRNEKFHVV